MERAWVRLSDDLAALAADIKATARKLNAARTPGNVATLQQTYDDLVAREQKVLAERAVITPQLAKPSEVDDSADLVKALAAPLGDDDLPADAAGIQRLALMQRPKKASQVPGSGAAGAASSNPPALLGSGGTSSPDHTAAVTTRSSGAASFSSGAASFSSGTASFSSLGRPRLPPLPWMIPLGSLLDPSDHTGLVTTGPGSSDAAASGSRTSPSDHTAAIPGPGPSDAAASGSSSGGSPRLLPLLPWMIHLLTAHDAAVKELVQPSYGELAALCTMLIRAGMDYRNGGASDPASPALYAWLLCDLVQLVSNLVPRDQQHDVRWRAYDRDLTRTENVRSRPDTLITAGGLTLAVGMIAPAGQIDTALEELQALMPCLPKVLYGGVPYVLCYVSAGTTLMLGRVTAAGQAKFGRRLDLTVPSDAVTALLTVLAWYPIMARLLTKAPHHRVALFCDKAYPHTETTICVKPDRVEKTVRKYEEWAARHGAGLDVNGGDDAAELVKQLAALSSVGYRAGRLCPFLARSVGDASVTWSKDANGDDTATYRVEIQPMGVFRKLSHVRPDELPLLFYAVLFALAVLHAAGLVHRAVQWTNVLWTSEHAFLIDLEAVGVIEAHADQSEPDSVPRDSDDGPPSSAANALSASGGGGSSQSGRRGGSAHGSAVRGSGRGTVRGDLRQAAKMLGKYPTILTPEAVAMLERMRQAGSSSSGSSGSSSSGTTTTTTKTATTAEALLSDPWFNAARAKYPFADAVARARARSTSPLTSAGGGVVSSFLSESSSVPDGSVVPSHGGVNSLIRKERPSFMNDWSPSTGKALPARGPPRAVGAVAGGVGAAVAGVGWQGHLLSPTRRQNVRQQEERHRNVHLKALPLRTGVAGGGGPPTSVAIARLRRQRPVTLVAVAQQGVCARRVTLC